MRRRPEYWTTPFGQWVGRYTPSRIAQELAKRGDPISPRLPYEWVEGRSRPRPERALTLVELSGGILALDDVFRHGQEVRRGRENRHC